MVTKHARLGNLGRSWLFSVGVFMAPKNFVQFLLCPL